MLCLSYSVKNSNNTFAIRLLPLLMLSMNQTPYVCVWGGCTYTYITALVCIYYTASMWSLWINSTWVFKGEHNVQILYSGELLIFSLLPCQTLKVFWAVGLPLWPLESVHDGLTLIIVNFPPNCTFPTFIRQLNGNSNYYSISIQNSGHWKALINHEQSITLIWIRYPINRPRGHARAAWVLLMKMIGSLHWARLSLVENKTNLSDCILQGERIALKCKINLGASAQHQITQSGNMVKLQEEKRYINRT